MTCSCGKQLQRSPTDFLGLPAYFQCECGEGPSYGPIDAKWLAKEELATFIPVLRDVGPI